jgi:hypothetical protein
VAGVQADVHVIGHGLDAVHSERHAGRALLVRKAPDIAAQCDDTVLNRYANISGIDTRIPLQGVLDL